MNKIFNRLIRGTILETLPNLEYKVQLDGFKDSVRCYVAGKMRMNKIKLMIGDIVECEYTPGHSVGRIRYRKS